LYFNNPMDITVPTRRFGMVSSTAYPAGLLYGVPSGNLPSYLWPSPPKQTPPIPNGTWIYPNTTSPTYSYINPPLIPYYPTLVQEGAAGTLAGSDIQLNDVISFDIRVLPLYPQSSPGLSPDPFVTLFAAPFSTLFISCPNSSFYPTDPTGPAVFDTWSSLNDGLSANYSNWNSNTVSGTNIPMWYHSPVTYTYPVNNVSGQTISVGTGTGGTGAGSGPIILAIQISIRIWDYKTNQTRQVTMVQAM
jgi:hypothetical protein